MVVDSSRQPLTEVLWLPWYPGGPAGPSAAGPKDATTEHVTLKGPEVTRRPERPGMVTEEGGGLLQQQPPTEALWFVWYPRRPAGPSAADPRDTNRLPLRLGI